MLPRLNHFLLGFSLHSLYRRKTKSIFTLLIFTILIFLLASVLFIAGSIKKELHTTLDALPEIIVQKIQAGRHVNIQTDALKPLLNIPGVQKAIPRVWGYYYFEKAGVNFSVVGIDPFDFQYKESFENIMENIDIKQFLQTKSMLIGQGVQKSLQENYYGDYFNFIKPDGSLEKIRVAGVFKGSTSLESNDVILMPQNLLREIFGIAKNKATDIIVHVSNPAEVGTIAQKIRLLFPDTRVITKTDLRVSYQNIFDYKSGLFLALFIVSAFTFFMIIYDRASGLNSEEKREIGILKALGWSMDDILKEKFYEGFVLSFLSFILAILLALFFVYTLQAPLLKEVFMGYSRLKPPFELPFFLDIQTISLLFFLSVPVYIAAILIPSWQVAAQDADEVMR